MFCLGVEERVKLTEENEEEVEMNVAGEEVQVAVEGEEEEWR